MSKQVIIKVESVGQAFGCQGVIYTPRGKRPLATTDVVPYSMRAVAYERAESIAADRGWTVAP